MFAKCSQNVTPDIDIEIETRDRSRRSIDKYINIIILFFYLRLVIVNVL